MKSFKKLSLLALFAISMASHSNMISANTQEISIEFQQIINQNFDNLINGNASFNEVMNALEEAALQENDPNLLEDIAFLKQNRKQILAAVPKFRQLYAKIENYLDQALKNQISNLGLAQWMKILMR